MDKAYRTIACAALVAVALLAGTSGFAEAQRPDGCGLDKKLPPTQDGGDLVIKVDCTVEPGTYYVGNVNIITGGTLRFTDPPTKDNPIHFWAKSILVENGGALIAGSPTPIGTNGGVVTIHLYGADQGTGKNGPGPGKGITCVTPVTSKGSPCGIPDDVWGPNGASKVPIPGVSGGDYFYRYDTLPYDGGDPKGYFGYKVLAVSYGGTLQLFGKKGVASPEPTSSSDSGLSWVRLNGSVKKGTNTLVVEVPGGRTLDWESGDKIVLTTTDYLPGHSEELTIDTITGNTITVKESLLYDHNGVKYDMSRVPAGVGPDVKSAETRAVVALLSRSIQIVSAGGDKPAGLPPPDFPADSFFGGHTLARQGFQSFQVQGVEFKQLGQGGRLGHYPVHFHMARKTPADTFIKDSSINESMTRWVVLHATHGVLVARNVGWKSIGHGFYLEEGSEIDNRFLSNVGIYARAAVMKSDGSAQRDNPRKVPGILAATRTGNVFVDNVPFHTDVDHPTLFWIMNGWNDFEYNMAVGAGTCGVCYWLVPGANSGMSQHMTWDGYASLQMWDDSTDPEGRPLQLMRPLQRAAMTPLRKFIGNYCSTAMNSFNVVGNTSPCLGVGGPNDNFPHIEPVTNPIPPAPCNQDNPLEGDGKTLKPDACAQKAHEEADHYYPKVTQGGGRFATQCGGPGANPVDCRGSLTPEKENSRCNTGNEANCMITAIDHYTSSFHWTELNFAAMWLRQQWYLVINSFLSDVQGGGLSFVTGGGYTLNDAPNGHWAVARQSAFVGNTQTGNAYSSNAGPFSSGGLACDKDNQAANYCLSQNEAVTFPLTAFGVNQRLFNIYDGPSFQESNAYLDITPTVLTDCQGDDKDPVEHKCHTSAWMYGRAIGVAQDDEKHCYLPNAAIAWKQPNGFYYPPAFHSRNLFFDPDFTAAPDGNHHVEIRHFVIEPLFKPRASESEPLFKTDKDQVVKRYCTWRFDMFNSFTDVDRQTELNDDDGSLTGFVNTSSTFKGTVSVNEDLFFRAPVEAFECASDLTAKTSPYDYVSTVMYPACAAAGQGPCPRSCFGNNCFANADCSEPVGVGKDCQCGANCLSLWGSACSDPGCFGIPLYRQYRTKDESKTEAHAIKMMGQNVTQRSTLSVNGGKYYVDTTVDKAIQHGTGVQSLSVFKGGETYYLFLLFAKTSTKQTYQIYVGDGFNKDDTEQLYATRVNVDSDPFVVTPVVDNSQKRIWPSKWKKSYGTDKAGVLEVTIDLEGEGDFAVTAEGHCRPATFCKFDSTAKNKCQCALTNPQDYLYNECHADDSAVCGWAISDFACPKNGCFGFAVKLPANFIPDNSTDHRPATKCFPTKEVPWNVNFLAAPVDLAGSCHQADPPPIPTCTD